MSTHAPTHRDSDLEDIKAQVAALVTEALECTPVAYRAPLLRVLDMLIRAEAASIVIGARREQQRASEVADGAARCCAMVGRAAAAQEFARTLLVAIGAEVEQ